MTETPQVQAAVERLYAAFARPRPTRIAGCPCCTDPADLCALTSVPLPEVDGPPARRFAHSALSTVGTSDDLRYLWPRLVELALPRWTDVEREVLFAKPRRAGWRAAWTPEEQAATEAFAHAVVAAFAHGGAALAPTLDWDGMQDLGDDLDRWVCAFGQCVEDVTALLDPLVEADPPLALLAFHAAQQPALADGKLWNAFWKGAATPPARVVAWFERPDVAAALAEGWDRHGPRLMTG